VASILKNWRWWLFFGAIIISIAGILFSGLSLGIDFNGGTLLQLELQKKVTNEEMLRIVNVITQRADPTGLKDVTVTPIGDQFISIQLTETDSVELDKIESRIRRQGKFESVINGEIIFTGDEIKKVERGSNSYGVANAGNNSYEWRLPFILNEVASKRFAEKTFHKCSASGFSAAGGQTYECEKTIFFLDKPTAVIITTEEIKGNDETLLLKGNQMESIPADTLYDELIQDAQLPHIVFATAFDANQIAELKASVVKFPTAIVPSDINESVISDLNSLGFIVEKVSAKTDGAEIPWIWTAVKAKQIISLSEGVTNEDVADISQAKIISELLIRGTRDTAKSAFEDLADLTILLESGSLPTPVKSVSREIISPSLGKNTLEYLWTMAICALIFVAIIIVIRYRNPQLVAPILIMSIAEIIIMLGVMALIKRPIDLAAFAGIIASIGTGVDSEIVITDEILGKSTTASTEPFLQRVKNAVFIVATSAFTMIAVMGPLLFFSRTLPGLEKLFGFAAIAIIGALAGVIITRPVFTKMIEDIVHGKKQN
jgi:preprotein translocase subunit SecD